jgi:deaminated glutathione amidase
VKNVYLILHKYLFNNLPLTTPLLVIGFMKSYLAAAIQMTSVPNLEKNLAQAEEFIDLAVHQGAELVGLPENFSFMGEEKDKLAQVEAIAKESEIFLKKMAQRY